MKQIALPIVLTLMTACGQIESSNTKGIGTDLPKEKRILKVDQAYKLAYSLSESFRYLSNSEYTINVARVRDMDDHKHIVAYSSIPGQAVELNEANVFFIPDLKSTHVSTNSKYLLIGSQDVYEFCSGSLASVCDINFVDGSFVFSIDDQRYVLPRIEAK